MKIVVFTSNAIRHKYLANRLAENVDDALVVTECKPNDAVDIQQGSSPLEEHFYLRYKTEKEMFAGNDAVRHPTLPLIYKEANLVYTYSVIQNFQPDLMFVFGASIIREPLLSLLPPGRFINLHLGLSPYYRGSGTNFWPFVNDELEYVGSTILHIDAGIDTGDIIAHVRPNIELGDDVHKVGNKVIKASADCLIEIMHLVDAGKVLNRVPQWTVPDERYYRSRDFKESVLEKYLDNLKNGMIAKYLDQPQKPLRLVSLADG